MKKVLYFLAASAAALCTVACNKDLNQNVPVQNPEQSIEEGGRCELTVGITGNQQTKATEWDPADEAEVNSLQILVFREESIDAYQNASSSKTATLSCTAGEREIYAVVNDIDCSTVKTKTEFLAKVSSFDNLAFKGFAMIGSTTKTLPQEDTVKIDVNRLASRVVLKKITRETTSPGLATLDFKVEAIWLQNVATDINFGLTATPTTWINKMKADASPVNYVYDAVNATIAQHGKYDTEHTFFCYPNPTVDDSSVSTWCPRHTRLVVKAKLGTNTYYYPITLPVLENNKSYEITDLTITRPGSTDPDTPVSINECDFKINVKPWTVVPVTDGVTI